MASFGASALADNWLSGQTLQDAVGMGQPALAPKEQTNSWQNFSPSIVVHGIDDTGLKLLWVNILDDG